MGGGESKIPVGGGAYERPQDSQVRGDSAADWEDITTLANYRQRRTAIDFVKAMKLGGVSEADEDEYLEWIAAEGLAEGGESA